jgi:hypothetical protein
MDLDTSTAVSEEEISELGIGTKDDAEIDVDAVVGTDDAAIDPDLIPDEEKEVDPDAGIFGDDAELENYMLSGYDNN